MKLTKTILMAFAAMLSVGMVSCNKEEIKEIGNPGGEKWVNLGLPSGLLWAKCNLGANVPEGYGDYYAWGETQTKEVYFWNTYRYCTVDENGYLKTLTKYNTSSTYGTIDNLTTLEGVDDAASARLGSGARTPTKEEWEELVANTTVSWTTVNGIKGRLFTATNGNTLFLPAAGCRYGSELRDLGLGGSYWSSSLCSDSSSNAWGFYFNPNAQGMDGNNGRRYGQSVRPVRSAQ